MEVKKDNYKKVFLSYTFRDKDPFVLTEPVITTLSTGETILIPKGFGTDFASVPTFLWGIVPPYGIDVIAFIIHDFLYDKGYYQKTDGEMVNVNRRFADKEMKFQQKRIAISFFRYYPMYVAVRLFGCGSWLKPKK